MVDHATNHRQLPIRAREILLGAGSLWHGLILASLLFFSAPLFFTAAGLLAAEAAVVVAEAETAALRWEDEQVVGRRLAEPSGGTTGQLSSPTDQGSAINRRACARRHRPWLAAILKPPLTTRLRC